MGHRDFVHFYVNGKEHRVGGAAVFQTLSDYLRQDLYLCGTKVVCAEGDCGACSVLVLDRQRSQAPVTGSGSAYKAVNACIQYLYQIDGAHIVTVEGLKAQNAINAVQSAMVDQNGAQCGYCTPGFITTMCALAQDMQAGVSACGSKDKYKDKTTCIKDALTGNLCRCTGYEAIIQAGLAIDLDTFQPVADLYDLASIDESLQSTRQQSVSIQAAQRLVFVPADLDSALGFLAGQPGARIVSGGTDVSVNINKRGLLPDVILSTCLLSKNDATLTAITLDTASNTVIIGALTSLKNVEAFFAEHVPEFARVLWVFGSPQIRNAGTLAGNIANGSPIGDSLPFLFVAGATIDVASQARGRRSVAIDAFYKGYKQLDLAPDELIVGIRVPLTQEILRLYNVSRRQHLDISGFTAAFALSLEPTAMGAVPVIKKLRVALGGVAATVLRMRQIEDRAVGMTHDATTWAILGEMARSAIDPLSDVRGARDYRLTLARNIFDKFYLETSETGTAPREPICK